MGVVTNMKRMTAALSVAAAVVLSAGLYAQTKLDFSGKWTVDTEKTATANPNQAGGGGRGGGRMGGGMAAPTTITMDGTTLKIERTMQDMVMAQTYKLDGSESKNMGMGRGGQTEQVSKATIDGTKVVIKTATPNGETVTSWYMDGAWLVNERTIGENVVKTYYKKG